MEWPCIADGKIFSLTLDGYLKKYKDTSFFEYKFILYHLDNEIVGCIDTEQTV